MKKIENRDPYPKMGEINKIIIESNIKLIDDLKKNLLLVDKQLTEKDKDDIYYILLESVWVSRWTDEKQQSLYAVLTPEEAESIAKDILTNLDNAGFKIVKK